MPKKYGGIDIVIGAPKKPKPVRSGPCIVCGHECYRELFISGVGWRWRDYRCDPFKPVITRKYAARTNAPMSYVPAEYSIKQTAPDQTFHKAVSGIKVVGR